EGKTGGFVNMEGKIGLIINNITVDEAREIMEKVREIEQRDTSRLIFTQIKGLEHKSVEEAAEVVRKVFPKKKIVR
ncbi:unnamed protein product, partial [marine sediment metagenome]